MLNPSIKLFDFSGVSGIYEKTLIINLSGSPKAVTEQFAAIEEVIPHAVDLIRDEKDKIANEHKSNPGIYEKICKIIKKEGKKIESSQSKVSFFGNNLSLV